MNERERDHAPYHERRTDQQMLDALLRIEELLKAFLVLLPVEEEERSASMMTSAEITAEAQKRTKGKRK
jgi:hypothetical protein